MSKLMTASLMLCACLTFAGPPAVFAEEDLESIFSKVNEHIEKKNFTKALEELSWAQKELEKMNAKRIEEFFPPQLGSYKGARIETQSMMGMQSIERLYTDEKGNSLSVSVMGGLGSGGGPLGGIAAFGRMAAMQGDTFRIDGLTASIDGSELSVFLDSGGIIKFDGRGNIEAEELKKKAREFKIKELDAYLSGK
jgi:hypothetical protein